MRLFNGKMKKILSFIACLICIITLIGCDSPAPLPDLPEKAILIGEVVVQTADDYMNNKITYDQAKAYMEINYDMLQKMRDTEDTPEDTSMVISFLQTRVLGLQGSITFHYGGTGSMDDIIEAQKEIQDML